MRCSITRSVRLGVSTLFLALVVFATNSPAGVSRLDGNVSPTAENVHLTLNADSANYSGEVTIYLKVQEPTNTFTFHAEAMELTATELSGQGGVIGFTYEETGPKGLTTATTERELASGNYTLKISFTNDFNTKAESLYRLDIDSAGYCFTQFEADDAREAFPCWDEPSYKIPWQLTLTVPERHEAVSNTPFEKETTEDGWKTVTFMQTPPLPSYLIAIATGTLEFVEIPGMSIPGRVVCVKGKRDLAGYAVESTPPILAELERYFDSKYPFRKLDLIAVPEFWAGAMENPGAITYRETILMLDPAQLSASQKRRLASVTAHELSHMWFGDVVTMAWWDDLWLNESFATWMGNKTAEKVFPEFKVQLRQVSSASGVMSSDARPSAQQIRQPIEDPDQLMSNVGAQYQKGQAVLKMFEKWLGEDVFRKGVVSYIKANEWSNATAEDLWAALSAASGKDVTAAMSAYVEKPGVPRVDVEIALDGSLTLTQSRFANYGHEYPDAGLWDIPVELKYYDGTQARTFSTTLAEKTMTTKLEADGPIQWALPNPGLSGYYRWAEPTELISAVAEEGLDHLAPAERIGYLANLGALLDAGVVSGGDYLKALSLFAYDEDPNVIRIVIAGLGKVHGSFVPDELEDKFAVFVQQTLKPALERFGYKALPGEDEVVSSLRPSLIGTLADEGQYTEALDFCEQLAKAYLKDPGSVDPSMIGTAVALSAHRGDMALYQEYKQRFETATNPAERRRFLGALGGFRDKAIWDDALNYVFAGPLRPQEYFAIPGSISGISEESSEYVFTWLQNHYDEVVTKIPPMMKMFLPYFASGCNKERLAEAQKFFLDDSRYTQGVETQMQKVADQVNDCASLREREGPAVAAYLNTIASR